jgi:ATP-binding cassette subfamily B protein RaxB
MLHLLNFSGRRRAPLILQTEAAECGLACLAMVSSFYGHRIDLPTLRRKHSISLKGATLAYLMSVADQLGLKSRPVKVELEDLDKLCLPAILHWDFNHFVVLTAASARALTIHDPARGERNLSRAEASKHFTGVALELTPTPAFQRVEERQRVGLRQLFGRVAGIQAALLQVLLLAAALEVFALAAPLYTQVVVDSAIVSEDHDLLTVLGIGFLLLGLIQVGLTAGRSWLVTVLGTSANYQLLSNLFHHLLHLPMSFFEKRHLGDVASRFESVSVIQRTLTTAFLEGIMDGVMTVVILGMMLVYSVQLTAFVCAAALLYAALRIILYRPLRSAQEEQILHAAKQNSTFLETVRGIQSVKLFNRQVQRRTLYQNRLVDNFNAGIRIQQMGILFKSLNRGLFCVENVAVIWVGALLVIGGGLSIGMLFAFLSFKQQFISRIVALIDRAVEFKMLSLHAERVADIALAAAEPVKDTAVGPATLVGTGIELRNIRFRYSESDPFVLDNISLRIGEGESVAVIGPSGCGKTTLVKVLLGLLPPSDGEVLVGGVSLASIGCNRLRDIVGSVMQDDQLFAGSISDNICFFDPEPDQERVERCAKIAAIHPEIGAMPMAYSTLVGDMGTALSGGQKQRVLLARALYKEPRILVLDEATSHLDVARERVVNDAIRELRITRVLIAHRPETIASADRVIRLGPGSVQSLGTVPAAHGPENRAALASSA